jgi:hypothetical protein
MERIVDGREPPGNEVFNGHLAALRLQIATTMKLSAKQPAHNTASVANATPTLPKVNNNVLIIFSWWRVF